MLSLLNRSRQNLLQEGKFKSFIFYSVGEVLLVMIGILLAVAIDDMNEDRKKKDEGLRMFQQFEIALKKDSTSLARHIQTEIEVQQGVDSVFLVIS